MPDSIEQQPIQASPEAPKRTLEKMSPDDFLRKLPPSLPGAARIDALKVAGAKRCIVHVRQMHPHSSVKDTDIQSVRNAVGKGSEIRSVQTDVHNILTALSKDFGTYRLYMEGVTQRSEAHLEVFEQTSKFLSVLRHKEQEAAEHIRDWQAGLIRKRQGLADARKQGKKTEDLEFLIEIIEMAEEDIRKEQEFLKKVQDKINDLRGHQKSIAEEIDRRLLAPGYLARTGRVTLTGAEDSQTRLDMEGAQVEVAALGIRLAREKDAAARQELATQRAAQVRELERLMLDQREYDALRKIQENGDTVGVTVYGGGHNWTKVVERWNAEHLDDKFMLVTITPKAYDAIEKARAGNR